MLHSVHALWFGQKFFLERISVTAETLNNENRKTMASVSVCLSLQIMACISESSVLSLTQGHQYMYTWAGTHAERWIFVFYRSLQTLPAFLPSHHVNVNPRVHDEKPIHSRETVLTHPSNALQK